MGILTAQVSYAPCRIAFALARLAAVLSPCTPTAGMIDWMGCASMRALPGRAANARSGRGYQVLVRGHRPRRAELPGVITPFVGTISIKEMMTSNNHNHSMSNLCFMIDIL